MAVSDIIRVGDKIDIRLFQQIENTDKADHTPQTYKSQVLGVRDNGNFEISMPSEKGKFILLPLGVRFEFSFYNYSGNLYKSIGQIVERYKKDGFYMMEIELKKPLEKIQRREFYRYCCAMDFSFYMLNEAQTKMKSATEVYRGLMKGDLKESACQGVIVDLSGGGMKFRSPYELKPDEQILVMLCLANDEMDRQFHILGKIIACVEKHTSTKVLYESRVRFTIEDSKIREEIIRYIFEEERKIRRKENG